MNAPPWTAPGSARWLSGPVAALALFVLGACNGDDAATVTVEAEPTTGGEAVVEATPTGPPESYVAAEHSVVLRVDMARVRASSIADDIGSLVRGYPTWEELLGRSGIDPVRDFDRVLVASPSGMSGRSVLVIRHVMSPAQVRQAVLDMAVSRGARADWRAVDGFDVVDWPADTDPPRLLVVTADHELVVCTAEDLDRVIRVAHDHRLRRRGPGAGDIAVEPALALEDGTIIALAASSIDASLARRFPHPPESLELVVRDDPAEEGRVHMRGHGVYADAAGAEEAREYIARQRDAYAGHMMVRAVGLDRVLREAQIGATGERLELEASFTEEEIERVLGLVALLQLSGS